MPRQVAYLPLSKRSCGRCGRCWKRMARARRSTNGFHSRSAYVVAGIQAAKPFCSSSLKWMLTQNGFQESVNLGRADPSSFKCGSCSTTWSKSATCFLFCTLVVDVQHAQHPDMRGYKRPVHRAVLFGRSILAAIRCRQQETLAVTCQRRRARAIGYAAFCLRSLPLANTDHAHDQQLELH